MTSQEVTKAFIERINAQDADGMYELMSEDHSFVEADGYVHQGRNVMRHAWRAYFSMMPDYWIKCEHVLSEGGIVAVFGRAGGTYTRDGQLKPENKWEVPAAWKVVVRAGKVKEWCIYVDVDPVRRIMAREQKDKT